MPDRGDIHTAIRLQDRFANATRSLFGQARSLTAHPVSREATRDYGTNTRVRSSSPGVPESIVTQGDMDVNCTAGSANCFAPSEARDGGGGVLSTSPSSYALAYGTGKGWDFATGISSVNVYQLFINWP
jgi:hypothetical protein